MGAKILRGMVIAGAFGFPLAAYVADPSAVGVWWLSAVYVGACFVALVAGLHKDD